MKIISTEKPFPVFSLEADRDYLFARLAAFSGSGFAPRAGYFAQQACEKYLKALLVQESKQYPKTHDLIELAKAASEFDVQLAGPEFIEKLKIFDNFREVGRYGGEATFDPHAQKEEGFETSGVYVWEGNYIKILDEIVFTVRQHLNFEKIGWSDSLRSILDGNQKDLLVSTWKLPIALLDILVVNNIFFKKE